MDQQRLGPPVPGEPLGFPGFRPESDSAGGTFGEVITASMPAAVGESVARILLSPASSASGSVANRRRFSHGGRLPGGQELFPEGWLSRSRASFRSSTTLTNTARATGSGRLSSHASSIWHKSKSISCGISGRVTRCKTHIIDE